MAMRPRLEMRQAQGLVMTPQLQQAIKLLQLSNLELTEYVEQELERNPLLEEAREDGEPDRPDHSDENSGSDEGGGDSGAEEWDAPDPAALSLSEDSALPTASSDLDTDYDNVYADEATADRTSAPAEGPQSSDWHQVKSGGGSFDGEDDFESRLTREQTLHEHLTEQLNVSLHGERERFIAAYMIDQVDDSGYLRESIGEISDRLGIEPSEAEAVLTVLQTFEPTGVCARSLQECLALQLAEKDRLDPIMQAFLDNLELYAKRDFAQLMKVCNIDADDIQGLIDDVKQCDPKPGHAFGDTPSPPVVPDVFIRQKADGGWAIELNAETLPRVLVNTEYYAEVSSAARPDDTSKAYLSECLANANWLVKSLDQRARTILKVSTEIVRQQDAFLMYGVSHLKPLNLKTVADAISMHESTVSRVTSNKYAATPRGIFELKYFFTSSIASTSGGDAHSAEAVRHRIRALIEAEEPAAVLSDDGIVELLQSEGIDIARRTVAKYREAMNIPSSVQRRREKKAFA
ncbi:RNA polymerase factor sigma-54 [Tepidicaulis sp. LMO-SS28]|uniref:RNA polymerase factor sigma-54 n=1 Tax=Tepidicaulis sp. LMO-SS28 TaxID=3447455 RepID=UPI003EE076A3